MITGMPAEDLTGRLLVASPSLKDPNFERSVVLLITHEPSGALGVVLNRATEVQVEDVLGREPIVIEIDRVGAYLHDKVVLVTGAGGSIGSELCRQIAHARARDLALVDASTTVLRRVYDELWRDRGFRQAFAILAASGQRALEGALAAHRPDVVFHVASHNYAPVVEDNPVEAVRTDVFGTLEFARLCGKYGVKRFVLVSNEEAAEFRGVFGTSKAMAEYALQLASEEHPETDYTAVRVGNLYRAAGSVIEVFDHQISHGGPVTLTDADGTEYPAKKTVFLCRCGGSTNKPFCDGTHSKVGFDAAERAVREEVTG